jgi:hypothetical protein
MSPCRRVECTRYEDERRRIYSEGIGDSQIPEYRERSRVLEWAALRMTLSADPGKRVRVPVEIKGAAAGVLIYGIYDDTHEWVDELVAWLRARLGVFAPTIRPHPRARLSLIHEENP